MTDEGSQPTVPPLVEEAMRKADIAWVRVAGGPARALWCLPHDGSLYLLTGPGEQDAPGLAGASTAEVILRGDHGGRIVAWPARVTRVPPESDGWRVVAPLLAAKRLNAPGPLPDLVQRWAASGVLSRLTPTGGAGAGPDDAQPAPPTAPATSPAD